MAKLVDHNIINNLLGSTHEKAVKVKVTLSGTAPPSALLHPYGYPAIGDPTDERLQELVEQIQRENDDNEEN